MLEVRKIKTKGKDRFQQMNMCKLYIGRGQVIGGVIVLCWHVTPPQMLYENLLDSARQKCFHHSCKLVSDGNNFILRPQLKIDSHVCEFSH